MMMLCRLGVMAMAMVSTWISHPCIPAHDYCGPQIPWLFYPIFSNSSRTFHAWLLIRHVTVWVLLHDCVGVIHLCLLLQYYMSGKITDSDRQSFDTYAKRIGKANLISNFRQPSLSPQILFRLGQVAPSFLAPLVSRLFLSPSEPLKSMRCALTLASAPYLFIF